MNAVEPLTAAEQTFIREHLQDDAATLLLKARPQPDLDLRKVVLQLTARQKARHKLPSWYANERLLFPPPLSVEQGSSEATARYKASLMQGEHLIDITGGMGVDCYYLSQRFAQSTYLEQQPEVAHAAAYNFGVLGASRIRVLEGEALHLLAQQSLRADWIYADPARRDDRQRKVVRLEDCTPDLIATLPTLLQHAPRLLIKTSPLLDIDHTVQALPGVREVHVLGLGSECKEVLYWVEAEQVPAAEVLINVRVLRSDGTVAHGFDFSRAQEAQAEPTYGPPLRYLYEPQAAVLKAGAFKYLSVKYLLTKLAPNSHFYSSEQPVVDFPGRSFEIKAVVKADAKEIARQVPGGKANLTVRNFPGSVQELRKKWRLQEGGSTYLFATTLADGHKVVLVTEKM
ncbi:SAM-dependent methyltransferase [Rhabdobacter roseus]|uniref:THUMP-like domain-containing protein n=1 Tax=Rhabdobacter roseus TaxID=1655419 RepID=A0A840TSP2_9BACT|nr:hypothetical protein [Rhabdobacter roseus]MBB5286314.1 hypothetical protein [Rhabdobacter roseus]